jgi:hypothetical protein
MGLHELRQGRTHNQKYCPPNHQVPLEQVVDDESRGQRVERGEDVYISFVTTVLEYTARARVTLAFCPPLSVMPFSPISV